MSAENEIWKPVVGFEKFYHVSNMGCVKALERHLDSAVSQSGKQRRKPRILRGGPASGGYRKVTLCRHGIQYYRLVHKLVVEAFIGPCPTGHEINHKNGIKNDNRLENLEWISHLNNMRHAIENGLIPAQRGRLSGMQVMEIKQLLATSTLTQRQIADAFGISSHTV